VINNSVDQENILIAVFVCYIIMILDKIVQLSYIYTLIYISRFANRNKLVSSHIIIELRYYYPDTRYNNNRGNSIPIYRAIFYYNNKEIVFWNPCIYLLNPN
jgi:CDP-diglyceride synthetase